MTINMKAPAGIGGQITGMPSGTTYNVPASGIVAVLAADVLSFLNLAFAFYTQYSSRAFFEAPLPADLVSISAAAIATNRALTIAAQPPHARKFQIRQVVVTAITAGVLTLVGTDQDGDAISEVFSLVGATRTLKTANAYAHLTSATVTGLVGGGDGTLGIGVSADFGVPGGSGAASLVCTKATKATKVLGTSIAAADDVASTAVVDAVARTIAPTTAPDAAGLIDFSFNYTFSMPTA